jgi:pimeloyl-ACP methyl ester carboxylesterase
MRIKIKLFSQILLIISFFAFANSALAKDTFVIVHGAFQDSSVWNDVKTQLEKSGDEVILVNLPGRKSSNSAVETASSASYSKTIIDAVSDRQNIILVGHSFGGIQISNVAEMIPEKIKALVYVAAYLPVSGESLQILSAQDKGNKFTQKNFLLAADYKTADVLAADRELIFCNDCNADAKQKLAFAFTLEPLAPMAEGAKISAEKFGKVKKVYVYTTLDNAVSYQLQTQMTAKTKVGKTFSMKTGHCPFLSQPKQLAKILRKAAKV